MNTLQSLLAAQDARNQARRAFAELVREYREERLNMPIDKLALRAGKISPTTLSNLETDIRSARRRTYLKLRKVFAADARLTAEDLRRYDEAYEALEEADRHYRQLAAEDSYWRQTSPLPPTGVPSLSAPSGPDIQQQCEPTDSIDRPDEASLTEGSETIPHTVLLWEPDEASETAEEVADIVASAPSGTVSRPTLTPDGKERPAVTRILLPGVEGDDDREDGDSETARRGEEQPSRVDETIRLDSTAQQGHEAEGRHPETGAAKGPQDHADVKQWMDRRDENVDRAANRSEQQAPPPLCPPPDVREREARVADAESEGPVDRSPGEDWRHAWPSDDEASVHIHRSAGPAPDGEDRQSATYRAHHLVLVTPLGAHERSGPAGQTNQTDRGGDDVKDIRDRVRQGVVRPAWLDARWARIALIAGSVVLVGLLILGIWSLILGADSSSQFPTETLGSGQCVNAPAGTIAIGRVTANGVAQYTTDATTGWIVELNRAATVCAPMSEGAVLQGVGDDPDSVARVLAQDMQQLQARGCVVNQGCQRIVTIRYPYP